MISRCGKDFGWRCWWANGLALGGSRRQWEAQVEGDDLAAESLEFAWVVAGLECGVDKVGNLHHVFFFHAAGGDGGGAEADAAAFADGLGIEGDGVFVDGDSGLVEGMRGFGSVDAVGAEVNEEDVVVGSAGDDAVAEAGEGCGEGFGVGDDLGSVGAEFGF